MSIFYKYVYMTNSIEERRVWKLKGGSYIISLPKDWVEKVKDNQLVVIKDQHFLVMYPKKHVLKKEAIVDMSKIKDPTLVSYYVLTYYMQGMERIKIRSTDVMDAQIKKRFRDIRNEMIGADIVEEKSDYLVYEILLDVTQQSISETIQKFNEFIEGVHVDTIKAIEELNKSLSEEIIERSKDGLKKYRLMIRQISIASQDPSVAKKIGIDNFRQAIVYGTVASYLNRMLHHTSYCNQYVLKLFEGDEVACDHVLRMAEVAQKMRNSSINAFIEKDLDSALKVIKLMSIQRGLEDELLNYLNTGKVSVNIGIVYSMIGKEMRRVSGLSVGIADALANLLLAPA
ncbi:MAG TPA: PhoU domain-containing protein [Geobacterales bacterium]|nr:PhoU domain-containing protein [Geobacterales bacterium]